MAAGISDLPYHRVIIMRMRRELLAARILRELASSGTTTWNPQGAKCNTSSSK
jgi:hypothetical protein